MAAKSLLVAAHSITNYPRCPAFLLLACSLAIDEVSEHTLDLWLCVTWGASPGASLDMDVSSLVLLTLESVDSWLLKLWVMWMVTFINTSTVGDSLTILAGLLLMPGSRSLSDTSSEGLMELLAIPLLEDIADCCTLVSTVSGELDSLDVLSTFVAEVSLATLLPFSGMVAAKVCRSLTTLLDRETE